MSRSLAIDPETNSIYICYFGNNRVQTDVNSLNVYYTDSALSHTVGSKGKKELEFDDPRGVVVSIEKDLICICDWSNNRVQCLNLQDYSFKSLISDVCHPKDVRLTSQEVVVLMEGGKCIRFYNYSHQLFLDIITYGEDNQVGLSSHLCIGLDSNILITDHSDFCHCVLMFSISEKLIHKIGEYAEDRGQFKSQKVLQ
ncbi:E3 ubiquitin-protein ligase TRIM71-like [Oopsacas minuta]|uniref:E3 ubiquitin-protein ligase TRIM71-like n=1 Tax=Oopsacas minuta TaxID=111878 RepID=A0AAV7JFU9_9METZ|nr:E3 ubiquitin-protein ligase TRIM71-like [Oopsacas minuta]